MGCCSTAKYDLENFKVYSHDEIVKQQIEEYPILIYAKTSNKTVQKMKTALRKLEVQFEVFELNNMNEKTEIQAVLQKITNTKAIPYVFIDGEYIGTDSDLFEQLESGKLLKKLDDAEIEYTK